MSILKAVAKTALTALATKMIIDLIEGRDYHTVSKGMLPFARARKQKSGYDPYKHVVNKPKPKTTIYVQSWVWIALIIFAIWAWPVSKPASDLVLIKQCEDGLASDFAKANNITKCTIVREQK